ncbi:glycoside hydrolase family 32 protein [Eubacteriales bacterium OttesenSCG-928-N13]|nr:glycoside hydrolase family 32 protein [Eubacteriales bacterium OttesenSCG-928-N13]
MYDEVYRPQFHFSPPQGWMNDPNGLIWYLGEYHLFYQHNPHDIHWDSMHWGHAVSTDLIHWENLPIAYTPEGPEDDYFTGSAILDDQNHSGFFDAGESGIVTIFTHRDAGVQQQSIGYSKDGRTFYRYPHCVLPNPGQEDFRDPKVVWWEERKRYLMALTVFDHVEFYTSKDLKKWTLMSKFGQFAGIHQGVWECSDISELPVRGTDEKRWVLIVGDQGASKTQYFVGHFEGKQFVSDDAPETHLTLDSGVDCYAGQTYSNMPDDRCVFISWLNSTHLFNCTPTSPWRSVYSVPRELWLERTENGVRLFQRPVQELNALRGEPVAFDHMQVDSQQSLGHIPPQFDCEVVLDVSQNSAMQMGMKLCVGEKQEIIVGYDTIRNVLYVNRSLSGNMSYASDIPPYLEARVMPLDGRVSLRILLDQSTLEIFTESGDVVISALVFPDATQNEVVTFARKGVGTFERIRIYPMRSIWKELGDRE